MCFVVTELQEAVHLKRRDDATPHTVRQTLVPASGTKSLLGTLRLSLGLQTAFIGAGFHE